MPRPAKPRQLTAAFVSNEIIRLSGAVGIGEAAAYLPAVAFPTLASFCCVSGAGALNQKGRPRPPKMHYSLIEDKLVSLNFLVRPRPIKPTPKSMIEAGSGTTVPLIVI